MLNHPKNDNESDLLEDENLNNSECVEDDLNGEVNSNCEVDKECDGCSCEREGYELKIKDLEAEVSRLKDLHLRLTAEFSNFKRRTQAEKQSTYNAAKIDTINSFLEVLDILERAISLVEEKNKFSEGIDLVISKFYNVLKSFGVEEMQSLGAVFNPSYHEAIKVVEDDKYEKNIVCEVFKKGFMLNGTVVRHALVVVANP